MRHVYTFALVKLENHILICPSGSSGELDILPSLRPSLPPSFLSVCLPAVVPRACPRCAFVWLHNAEQSLAIHGRAQRACRTLTYSSFTGPFLTH